MGIVNLTPDSFSADGLYQGLIPRDCPERVFIERMVDDGADIIDMGGESTVGRRTIPVKEELERTIPIIKKIARKIKVLFHRYL